MGLGAMEECAGGPRIPGGGLPWEHRSWSTIDVSIVVLEGFEEGRQGDMWQELWVWT